MEKVSPRKYNTSEKSLSLKTTTSKERIIPSNTDNFSLFGDSSCGEPLFAQRIRLDFTPDEEIDNDFAQQKCCDFWELIENSPQIHHLMVMPEKNEPQRTESSETSEISDSGVEDSSIKDEPKTKTALSVLEFVEEKGLIDRIFEAKIKESHCTLGSREYKELENITHYKKRGTGMCFVCHPYLAIAQGLRVPTGPCTCGCVKIPPEQAMRFEMKDWDLEHRKSMEPPGHPPSVQHCILQRRVDPADD